MNGKSPLIIGPVVFEFIFKLLARIPTNIEKITCNGALRLGGTGINVGRAYRAATCCEPTIATFLGPDPLGDLAATELDRQFAYWVRVDAMESTQVSCSVPANPSLDGAQRIYTTRPAIDTGKTMEKLGPLIDRHEVVFVAPLAGSNFKLGHAILDRVNQNGGTSYLMLSTDQLAHRDDAIDLASKATYLLGNNGDSALLSGVKDDWLTSTRRCQTMGIYAQIITAAERGAFVLAGCKEVYHPGYEVNVVQTTGAGNVFAGTLIAAQSKNLPTARAIGLANAAAAMHVSGQSHQWKNLAQLHDYARRMPVRGTMAESKQSPAVAILRPAILGTAGVVAIAAVAALFI